MELKDLLIPELQYEVVLTEKFLNRIPADKMDWRPHPRSMSIKELANHLAEIPAWVTGIMQGEELDLTGYKSPDYNSVEDIIKLLKNNTTKAEDALRKPNEEYEVIWKLTKDGKTLVEMPRLNMLRSMALNQLPHHRAQLGVYFRLLDIPVPASYGPSADEN
ncbi:MAG: DinB family protein [Gillisia sp.]